MSANLQIQAANKDVDAGDNSLETSISTRAVIRAVLLVLLVLAAVVLLGAIVYWISGLILLVVFAIFFAYLIAPLVDLIQHPFSSRNRARWMPRPLAITFVYLFLAAVLYGAGAYLLPFVNEQSTLR